MTDLGLISPHRKINTLYYRLTSSKLFVALNLHSITETFIRGFYVAIFCKQKLIMEDFDLPDILKERTEKRKREEDTGQHPLREHHAGSSGHVVVKRNKVN